MANITASHIYETTAYSIDGTPDDQSRAASQTEFNDRTAAESGGRVTSISVSFGQVIDSVSFSYDYSISGDTHGGSGGEPHLFLLEEDEYLTGLEWTTAVCGYYGGTVLTKIRFTTNKKRVFRADGSLPSESFRTYYFTAEDRYAIVGLKGWCGGYLNQLTKVLCRQLDENFQDDRFYYDDYYSLLNAERLTKVIIRSGLVIDALQLVYDDNTSLTSLHGGSGGDYSEFPIQKDDYITKIKYLTGQVDFAGYGSSQVMLQLELWTKKGKYLKTGLYGMDFSDLDKGITSHITNRRVYSCTMKDNEELFCFAGVYSSYMGRILTVYKRQRSAMTSAGQRNSDGKKYLFVCQQNKKEGNEVTQDKAVAALVSLMLENYHKLSEAQKAKITFLPNVADSTALLSSKVIISDTDFQKAILSGQYTYISIRSHGTEAGCGNPGAGLMDVKWVRSKKWELFSKLQNTVINFNCCECGCRHMTEQYPEYEGLARELVKAGARAVFGYTIGYLSVEDPSVIQDPSERTYYLRFYNLIDNKYMQLDGTKDPEDIAELIEKNYETLLKGYKALLPNIDDLNGKEGISFTNCTELVLAIGRKLRQKNPKNYTEDGDATTTTGADDVRNELKAWLKRNLGSRPAGYYQRLYTGFVNFYTNCAHLVGPGDADPDQELKENNLGELCNEFCYWDGGL